MKKLLLTSLISLAIISGSCSKPNSPYKEIVPDKEYAMRHNETFFYELWIIDKRLNHEKDDCYSCSEYSGALAWIDIFYKEKGVNLHELKSLPNQSNGLFCMGPGCWQGTDYEALVNQQNTLTLKTDGWWMFKERPNSP